MRRGSRSAAFAVILAVSLAGAPVRADDDDARALSLFEQSERAYDAGRFAEAISLLQQSYVLKKEPVLLYNLGRAHEGNGDLGKAADAYEAFLKAQPDAPDRGALERRIGTLRKQLAEREALARQAKEREKPPPKEHTPSVAPWIVSGIGVAGIGTGVAFGLLSRGKHSDAVSDPTYAGADHAQSQARTFATVANVCLVSGAVVLVAGIVWYVLDR
jgi:tetratricopeptide (TPR) repeat protein